MSKSGKAPPNKRKDRRLGKRRIEGTKLTVAKPRFGTNLVMYTSKGTREVSYTV